MLIDTHTHLYLPEFDPSPESAVDRAVETGVGIMVMPNVDVSTIEPLHKLHNARPESTVMAMGLHPTEINSDYRKSLDIIERLIIENPGKYVAVGEIGIDLYWDATFIEQQKQAFKEQCELAVRIGLPVIIHCRNGLKETLEILESLETVPAGVFHSFGGSPEDVKQIRAIGDFYFGINGIATFKNSRLNDTIKEIGIDRLLLETDSPYLAPVPHRGKRNESSFIIHTAAHVAKILDTDIKQLEEITTLSAVRLFNL